MFYKGRGTSYNNNNAVGQIASSVSTSTRQSTRTYIDDVRLKSRVGPGFRGRVGLLIRRQVDHLNVRARRRLAVTEEATIGTSLEKRKKPLTTISPCAVMCSTNKRKITPLAKSETFENMVSKHMEP